MNEENNTEERRPDYNGLPFSSIIAEINRRYYAGMEPGELDSATRTYELAMMLRHITNYSEVMLNSVIPLYKGMTEETKQRQIKAALTASRTQMPQRLRDVLYALRKTFADNEDIQQVIDDIEIEDELFYYNRLGRKAMPTGIIDSVDAVGRSKAMAVVYTVTAVIGALATKVRLNIHGKPSHLNIDVFVCGSAASGKGSLDDVVAAWTEALREQDRIYLKQEREWRERAKRERNAKKLPDQPHLPIRLISLNNTVANVSERLANVDGIHAFSYTPEGDIVAQKWGSALTDFSVMKRMSYDGVGYSREAKSLDSVNVHIEKLLWNSVLVGTSTCLYKVVRNVVDGQLSRLAIAAMPDNTFTPLADREPHLTDPQADNIRSVARLLMLMQGDLDLPRLERRCREWLEEVRRETLLNDDRVKARCRLRDHVTAMRMTTALMLASAAAKLIRRHGTDEAERMLKEDPTLTATLVEKEQTREMLDAYSVIADSITETKLQFFRSRLEKVYASSEEGGGNNIVKRRPGKNDSIYERLPQQFTFDQAMQQCIAIKGVGVSRNSTSQMIKNWKTQGLVYSKDNYYVKVVEQVKDA